MRAILALVAFLTLFGAPAPSSAAIASGREARVSAVTASGQGPAVSTRGTTAVPLAPAPRRVSFVERVPVPTVVRRAASAPRVPRRVRWRVAHVRVRDPSDH